MKILLNTPNIPNAPINSAQNTVKSCNAKQSPEFKGKVVSIKTEERMSNLGLNFSSAMQRLVTGVTALMTQPFFDWNNKNVDEDTRKTSTARTLGKIIAGTMTGFAIRWGCVKATENFTRNESTEQFLRENPKPRLAHKALSDKDVLKHQGLLPESLKKASYREIKNYRAALGTLAAVVIMIGTNFLIDAPLTTYFTNKFVKWFKKPEPSKAQSVQGGEK